MSDNFRFYAEKMAERRARPQISESLLRQLDEIFRLIRHCEAIWAVEERIEKQL